MAGGRPSKFKPEFVEQARKLATLGATDREAAEFFGVTESTLYLWKHTEPEFSEALKVGKETADARVEQSLYRRALGYSHDAVKIFMPAGAPAPIHAPFTEHFPPDTTAAIFWLKNRRPDLWRDVKAQELSGPGGGPIQTVGIGADEAAALTKEKRAIIREAIMAVTETSGEKTLRMIREGGK